MIHIEHKGRIFNARALIDPGSQRSFLSTKFKNKLQILTRESNFEVFGIGAQVQSTTEECDVVLFAKRNNLKFSVRTIVLPKVTQDIPSVSFTKPHTAKLAQLDLADPCFNQRSQIDRVLGNDCERFVNTRGIGRKVCGLASAYKTVFGWVLSGPVVAQPIHSFTISVSTPEKANHYQDLYSAGLPLMPSKNSDLNDLLRKFWEQEELHLPPVLSKEDQYCEEFYKRTTTRGEDGRYVVRLPFKKEVSRICFSWCFAHTGSRPILKNETITREKSGTSSPI